MHTNEILDRWFMEGELYKMHESKTIPLTIITSNKRIRAVECIHI